MNEALLQYLWNFKKLKRFDFCTTEGQELEVLDFGKWNRNAGPDFLMGKIKYGDLTFVGNIELHLKSSDWFHHHHGGNPDYENLILHVVYQNDAQIPELQNRKIPTLVLKDYIDPEILYRYRKLQQPEKFIACEELFYPEAVPLHFAEEKLLSKLEEKSEHYLEELAKSQNDFEALLFTQLSYAFGLKVNAPVFYQLASMLDYPTFRKISKHPVQVEALFFGMCGWLQNPVDEQMKLWKREFDFLNAKFKLPNVRVRPKFSKMYPPGFPTIRLSQLAALYAENQLLFSEFIQEADLNKIFKILRRVRASAYWDDHFKPEKLVEKSYPKTLSESFIERILINTILPLQYFFRKQTDPEAAEDILELYRKLPAEDNKVIRGWKKLGVSFGNALQSQAFLYHYKNFCVPKKCLNCSIGYNLLKHAGKHPT